MRADRGRMGNKIYLPVKERLFLKLKTSPYQSRYLRNLASLGTNGSKSVASK